MELTYKRATLKDIDALVDERIREWKAANPDKTSGAEEATEEMQRQRTRAYSYYRRNLTDHEDVVYMAYDGSRIAGIGNVYFVHRRPALRNQDKERAVISQLYTRPGYQSSGVGYKLLDLLVNAAMENEAEEISVDNDGKIAPVLQKYGFREEGDQWVFA